MSRELINRITIKKDGVYVSTHSSNDNAPYHSVKIDLLTDKYNEKGQNGLDREIISMIFNYAELRGSHPSLQRYLYAYNSEYANKLYKEYTDRINDYYQILSEEDKQNILSLNPTVEAKKYNSYSDDLRAEMYSKIAIKCEEYDLINNLVSNNKDGKSFKDYENIIDKIIEVSDDYTINFDNYCPFDSFGSDEESENLGMCSFSDYYKEILQLNHINIKNITTKEKSDGKYIITIDNKYDFEINAWTTFENVVDNVEIMVNQLKSKETMMNYENDDSNNKYYIKLWITEHDRNQGFVDGYYKDFNNLEEAIKDLRKYFNDGNCVCAEIYDKNDRLYYTCDNESEDFYLNEEKISLVDKKVVNEYIDNWNNNRKQTFTGKNCIVLKIINILQLIMKLGIVGLNNLILKRKPKIGY